MISSDTGGSVSDKGPAVGMAGGAALRPLRASSAHHHCVCVSMTGQAEAPEAVARPEVMRDGVESPPPSSRGGAVSWTPVNHEHMSPPCLPNMLAGTVLTLTGPLTEKHSRARHSPHVMFSCMLVDLPH